MASKLNAGTHSESVVRAKLLELIASLPRCLIGMEAWSVPITGLGFSQPTATLFG